ncbi:MAG: hypothetical protein M3R04_06545 [bacterium]|nr:hypothetical protein [bacterium]
MSPRIYPRKFDWDEAAKLRALGFSFVEIARRFGVSVSAVAQATNPELRARVRRRSEAHQKSGTCIECGGPSSRNYSKGPYRCFACAAKAKTKVKGGTAYCPVCTTWKSIDEFTPSLQRKARGVRPYCRACETGHKSCGGKPTPTSNAPTTVLAVRESANNIDVFSLHQPVYQVRFAVSPSLLPFLAWWD